MLSTNIKKMIISPVNYLITAVILIAIIPLFYYGKDSIIPIHDNLDSTIPWLKMLKENGLLFALNSPTNVMGDMSTAYFIHHSFNLLYILYAIFDVFTAHIIGYVIKIIAGYISMYLLLRYILPSDKNRAIIKLVSLAFALLPSVPLYWLAIDTVPLLCFVFLVFMKQADKIDKKIFLLLLFPLLSSFGFIGFFLLTLWVLCTIIVCIINKKVNLNLVIGFFMLIIGYVVVDIRVFYNTLFLNEPTNRSIFDFGSMSLREVFNDIPTRWFDNFITSYQAPHLAQYIVIPVIFIVLTAIILRIFCKINKDQIQLEDKTLTAYCTKIIILLIVSIIFASISTLYNSGIVHSIINTVFPFLRGFHWYRIILFNRVLFYIGFAYVLTILLLIFKYKLLRFFVFSLTLVQIIFIILYPTFNNYSRNLIQYRDRQFLTYNEFFSVDLFTYIKEDLQYNGEGVAALGYHPSVLMYSGFSTVDGYLSFYPLARMIAFREVIAPQLERNPEQRRYFDGGGIRMYLYNDDLSYQPTRTKAEHPVNLYINTEAFRNLGGVYILSRAEISNADELELTFINSYSKDDSVYDIFVYITVR
ncbi:MAG: DUF6044 family protein [Oscillospiraceae bacterium]|jgi:hypothetical protein|nr:DUF6044 family protein [Oscillospiraceae bacterium]